MTRRGGRGDRRPPRRRPSAADNCCERKQTADEKNATCELTLLHSAGCPSYIALHPPIFFTWPAEAGGHTLSLCAGTSRALMLAFGR